MTAAFLEPRLASFGDEPALACGSAVTTYSALLERAGAWSERLVRCGIGPGTCVAYRAGFDPDGVSLFLALLLGRHIAVPWVPGAAGSAMSEQFLHDARADVLIHDPALRDGRVQHRASDPHPLIAALRSRGEAGLILFSSGSTGVPKAALLSLDRLLDAHRTQRRGARTLAFLDSGHIGGINTLLHTLCHGGVLVVPQDRTPAAVMAAIVRHRAEVLPTTPTFLNLLLMSGGIGHHDLSALRLVSYGTECMPQATLAALQKALPDVRLKQTYGSTELGILPTRSREDGSRWMEMGGDTVALRLKDGRLFARSPAQMLGYLNAPQPFDDEGWYDTGDLVEERAGMLRIAGRATEVINVGGQKVMPAEVENCLLQADNVLDAVVEGRHSPVTGQVVTARVVLRTPEETDAAEDRLLDFCRTRLGDHEVPVLFSFTTEPLHSARFKRHRTMAS